MAQHDHQHRWMLSQAAFDALMNRLDADRERAGEKYKTLQQKLIKFFEWRSCFPADEHADETINRVAIKVHEGETILNLFSYAYGVAKMINLENVKRREHERAALAAAPPPMLVPADTDDSELRRECLENCLRKLSSENRALITNYYQGERQAKIAQRKKLAACWGIPLNALRIRAYRIRAVLEDCVAQCLALRQAHEII